MKPLKIYKESRDIIDSEKEHYVILVELGILDDMENWPLYQEQERKYFKLLNEVSDEKYSLYVNKRPTYSRKNVVKEKKGTS